MIRIMANQPLPSLLRSRFGTFFVDIVLTSSDIVDVLQRFLSWLLPTKKAISNSKPKNPQRADEYLISLLSAWQYIRKPFDYAKLL